MDERGGLENRWLFATRGFESHSLRHISPHLRRYTRGAVENHSILSYALHLRQNLAESSPLLQYAREFMNNLGRRKHFNP